MASVHPALRQQAALDRTQSPSPNRSVQLKGIASFPAEGSTPPESQSLESAESEVNRTKAKHFTREADLAGPDSDALSWVLGHFPVDNRLQEERVRYRTSGTQHTVSTTNGHGSG